MWLKAVAKYFFFLVILALCDEDMDHDLAEKMNEKREEYPKNNRKFWLAVAVVAFVLVPITLLVLFSLTIYLVMKHRKEKLNSERKRIKSNSFLPEFSQTPIQLSPATPSVQPNSGSQSNSPYEPQSTNENAPFQKNTPSSLPTRSPMMTRPTAKTSAPQQQLAGNQLDREFLRQKRIEQQYQILEQQQAFLRQRQEHLQQHCQQREQQKLFAVNASENIQQQPQKPQIMSVFQQQTPPLSSYLPEELISKRPQILPLQLQQQLQQQQQSPLQQQQKPTYFSQPLESSVDRSLLISPGKHLVDSSGDNVILSSPPSASQHKLFIQSLNSTSYQPIPELRVDDENLPEFSIRESTFAENFNEFAISNNNTSSSMSEADETNKKSKNLTKTRRKHSIRSKVASEYSSVRNIPSLSSCASTNSNEKFLLTISKRNTGNKNDKITDDDDDDTMDHSHDDDDNEDDGDGNKNGKIQECGRNRNVNSSWLAEGQRSGQSRTVSKLLENYSHSTEIPKSKSPESLLTPLANNRKKIKKRKRKRKEIGKIKEISKTLKIFSKSKKFANSSNETIPLLEKMNVDDACDKDNNDDDDDGTNKMMYNQYIVASCSILLVVFVIFIIGSVLFDKSKIKRTSLKSDNSKSSQKFVSEGSEPDDSANINSIPVSRYSSTEDQSDQDVESPNDTSASLSWDSTYPVNGLGSSWDSTYPVNGREEERTGLCNKRERKKSKRKTYRFLVGYIQLDVSTVATVVQLCGVVWCVPFNSLYVKLTTVRPDFKTPRKKFDQSKRLLNSLNPEDK
ncbi:hypothetical protein HELRODRAFT_163179 [Helobdella robusta]|uniref:Uncharacterized protein n=1 Tax=Helobdella robusta TaxID=6412 RepID=T1ETR7_HELRO|nr:hypothetical protein HELRODRAFT_163179 [Helobdella robusta]ESN96147.1 hypothetical protein HELRODRAFT_163179 [Helobdella robusta]